MPFVLCVITIWRIVISIGVVQKYCIYIESPDPHQKLKALMV